MAGIEKTPPFCLTSRWWLDHGRSQAKQFADPWSGKSPDRALLPVFF
jgi:hypothetical protein